MTAIANSVHVVLLKTGSIAYSIHAVQLGGHYTAYSVIRAVQFRKTGSIAYSIHAVQLKTSSIAYAVQLREDGLYCRLLYSRCSTEDELYCLLCIHAVQLGLTSYRQRATHTCTQTGYSPKVRTEACQHGAGSKRKEARQAG